MRSGRRPRRRSRPACRGRSSRPCSTASHAVRRSGRREKAAAGRHRLVDDDRFSGNSAPSEAPSASGVILPLALAGGGSLTTGAGVARAPTSSAGASSAPPCPRRGGPALALGIGRRQQARLVRVGEERDRHFRADEDDVLQPGQDLYRLVDDIGHPFDKHPAAAALGARVRALGDQSRPGLGGDPAGEVEPRRAQGAPGHQDEARLARAQRPRGLGDRLLRHRLDWGRRWYLGRARPLVPGGVGRQDRVAIWPGGGGRRRSPRRRGRRPARRAKS